MSVIGIVCEYNPFHKGHMFHIDAVRRDFDEDSTVVCVMSGDFVQRGEPALYSKFARAEAACRCGADLVVELPLPWCLASAEGFARGAVSMLNSLGAEYISFGSEAGELEPLEEIARVLLSKEHNTEIKQIMAERANLSYAAARQLALEGSVGEKAELISSPNNILAVEYLKAIYACGLKMRAHTVKRTGAGHDSAGGGEIKSASELRLLIKEGNIATAAASIPEEAEAVFSRERNAGRIINNERFDAAVMARLRMLSKEECEALPDAGDGLGLRLWKAAREEESVEAVIEAVKSKRYAMARIRRMTMCAALGVKAHMSKELPVFGRVLASNEKGFAVLKQCNFKGEFSIISKPAQARELSLTGRSVFELGADAHDLFSLAYEAKCMRKAGNDWRTSPFVVEKDKETQKN